MAHPDKRAPDHILRVLSILKSVQEYEKELAQEQLRLAAEEGWLHHHLMHAFEDGAWDAAADLIAEIGARLSLTRQPPEFHRAREAHEKLRAWIADETPLPELDSALLESNQRERLRRFVDLRLHFDDAPTLVKRLLAAVEPYESLAEVVPGTTLVQMWPKVEATCGEDEAGLQLLQQLVDQGIKSGGLIGIATKEFSEERIELYRKMVASGAMSDDSFSDFMSESLAICDESAWTRAIDGETTLDVLLWKVRDHRPQLQLEKPYQRALYKFGKGLMDESAESLYESEQVGDVLDAMEEASRLVLAKDLRDALSRASKSPSQEFIDFFGEDLQQLVGTNPQPNDLRLIVRPALESDEIKTVEFAAQLLKANPAVVKAAPKEDQADLRSTLKGIVSADPDSPIGAVRKRAGEAVGMKWGGKKSEGGRKSGKSKNPPSDSGANK